MKWADIERNIRLDIETIHKEIKELAPQNSTYTELYRGRMVDFIIVGGNRVYSNTNNLYNSVMLRVENSGNDIIATTFVDETRVPYYSRAVLLEYFNVIKKRSYTEYDEMGYFNPRSDEWKLKENRNYLYYMKAVPMVRATLSKWNGTTFRITDKIGDFL